MVYQRLSELTFILDQIESTRLLVVADEGALTAIGIEDRLVELLSGKEWRKFTGFASNPALSEVERGMTELGEWQPAAVLAIGGGAAIDLAKLLAAASTNPGDRRYLFEHGPLYHDALPLVAIPTTAGTGSEATPFAVMYIDGDKHSVEHASLLPQHVVLDPSLSSTMPPRLTAATGLDAFCQGVEAWWGVRSTTESDAHAAAAITLAWRHLPAAVHAPTPVVRAEMCAAAHRSGQAIRHTRTSAPHALSYHLTSHYGVPHGFAVALTLPAVWRWNQGVGQADCADPRARLCQSENVAISRTARHR
jgi:alcohol dehydrogenase